MDGKTSVCEGRSVFYVAENGGGDAVNVALRQYARAVRQLGQAAGDATAQLAAALSSSPWAAHASQLAASTRAAHHATLAQVEAANLEATLTASVPHQQKLMAEALVRLVQFQHSLLSCHAEALAPFVKYKSVEDMDGEKKGGGGGGISSQLSSLFSKLSPKQQQHQHHQQQHPPTSQSMFYIVSPPEDPPLPSAGQKANSGQAGPPSGHIATEEEVNKVINLLSGFCELGRPLVSNHLSSSSHSLHGLESSDDPPFRPVHRRSESLVLESTSDRDSHASAWPSRHNFSGSARPTSFEANDVEYLKYIAANSRPARVGGAYRNATNVLLGDHPVWGSDPKWGNPDGSDPRGHTWPSMSGPTGDSSSCSDESSNGEPNPWLMGFMNPAVDKRRHSGGEACMMNMTGSFGQEHIDSSQGPQSTHTWPMKNVWRPTSVNPEHLHHPSVHWSDPMAGTHHSDWPQSHLQSALSQQNLPSYM